MNDVAIVAGVRTGPQLATNSEQRRKKRCLEQSTPMIVDFILEAGKASGVCAGLTLEHDGFTIRNDDPIPDQEYAGLAERDLAVVLPDQTRALRNQGILSGWTVINILRHLRSDFAGQI